MATTMSGPFVRRVQEATRGEFPDDGSDVEVGPALAGPCDAVAFLPGRTVVAADVDEQWVTDELARERQRGPEDASTGLGRFVAAMAARLGDPPTYASVLTAAPHRAAVIGGRFRRTGRADPGWAAYRTDVTSYHYDSPSVAGDVDVGRGPGGRWDVFVRVDREARGGGGGSRQLLAAALTLVPPGEELYGAAPVHDIRALRTMLAGGFRPVCTEVLFLTRPRR